MHKLQPHVLKLRKRNLAEAAAQDGKSLWLFSPRIFAAVRGASARLVMSR